MEPSEVNEYDSPHIRGSARYSRLYESPRGLVDVGYIYYKQTFSDNLPIHTGGRRLTVSLSSHDPFLLCEDYRKIELGRKSAAIQKRPQSQNALLTEWCMM